MKIAVVGGGALGLLWGARLAQLPHHFSLLTRTSEQKKELEDRGILLHELQINQKVISTQVETTKTIPIHSPFDIVWITVKQFDLSSLIHYIQAITHSDSQILFLQNGWGHSKIIKQLKNRPWTYGAITTEGARKVGHREVYYNGFGENWIGFFPERKQQPHALLLELIEEINQKHRLHIQITGEVIKKIWEKLMINSIINPITAIYGVKNGALLDNKWELYINSILDEALQVTEKMGMTFCKEELIKKVKKVCIKTAQNNSSMLQDIQCGSKTEIDYINGAIVKLGEKMLVDTPINREWVRKIYEKERSMCPPKEIE